MWLTSASVAQDDRYACMADVGWITGHTYIVYGPLANGVTTTIFESTPVYPTPSRFWEVVAKHKLTQVSTLWIRNRPSDIDLYPALSSTPLLLLFVSYVASANHTPRVTTFRLCVRSVQSESLSIPKLGSGTGNMLDRKSALLSTRTGKPRPVPSSSRHCLERPKRSRERLLCPSLVSSPSCSTRPLARSLKVTRRRECLQSRSLGRLSLVPSMATTSGSLIRI